MVLAENWNLVRI